MLDIESIRSQFPWLKNNPGAIYFDSAATSLKPECVLDAIQEYYRVYSANPHNADSEISALLHREIEATRAAVADYVGCEPGEIAFTSGATESLNLFAFGLEDQIAPGDEILVPDLEHASNVIPWMVVAKRRGARLVGVPESGAYDWRDNLLARIGPKTKIVAFSTVSNVFGAIADGWDLSARIAAARPGAIVAIDATQEIQHHRLDLRASPVGLLAFSGHKMFGPTGVGVAFVRKDLQPLLRPLKYGGGMFLDYDTRTMDVKCLHTPAKYEGGTQNVAGIMGLKAAIGFINRIGVQNVLAHELELVGYLIERLRKIPGVRVINADPKTALVTIAHAGASPQDLAYYLNRNKIVVRAGVSCVNMIKHRESDAAGYVRVSLSVYNTKAEIDRFAAVLAKFSVGESLVGLV